LRWLLEDFGVSVSMTTPLLSDSTFAISIARDVKHVGVDACTNTRWCHWSSLCAVRTSADFFTKALTRAQHMLYLSKLFMIHLEFERGVRDIFTLSIFHIV